MHTRTKYNTVLGYTERGGGGRVTKEGDLRGLGSTTTEQLSTGTGNSTHGSALHKGESLHSVFITMATQTESLTHCRLLLKKERRLTKKATK